MISQLVTNIPILTELGLYIPESDELALNTWRSVCPKLAVLWPDGEPRVGVKIGGSGTDAGRVVSINLQNQFLNLNSVCVLPAELGWLTALTFLNLGNNLLTSVPADLGRAVQVDPGLTALGFRA